MKKFKSEDLVYSIVKEHYDMAKKTDQSISYLWYMYDQGTKSGEFRPFIYMAEMQLLKEMGYVNVEEISNMVDMLSSDDKDNFYILSLSLNTLRNKRIKDHGRYADENEAYTDLVNNYTHRIVNHDLFTKTYVK